MFWFWKKNTEYGFIRNVDFHLLEGIVTYKMYYSYINLKTAYHFKNLDNSIISIKWVDSDIIPIMTLNRSQVFYYSEEEAISKLDFLLRIKERRMEKLKNDISLIESNKETTNFKIYPTNNWYFFITDDEYWEYFKTTNEFKIYWDKSEHKGFDDIIHLWNEWYELIYKYNYSWIHQYRLFKKVYKWSSLVYDNDFEYWSPKITENNNLKIEFSNPTRSIWDEIVYFNENMEKIAIELKNIFVYLLCRDNTFVQVNKEEFEEFLKII